MHRRAEYGVAAHWKYKEETVGGRKGGDMQWLRQLLDWQKETADPAEFLGRSASTCRSPRSSSSPRRAT